MEGLIDTRNEYIEHIQDIIAVPLSTRIYDIWCDCSKIKGSIKEFQKELIQIKKWNNNIIYEEYKKIIKKTKCKYLPDLIKIIIITTIKIKIYEYKDQFSNIKIKIPLAEDFIHKCYINISIFSWKNAYLFNNKNIKDSEYQNNLNIIEENIRIIIKKTFRDFIPFDDIFQQIQENIETNSVEEDSPRDNGKNKSSKHGGGKTEKPNTTKTPPDEPDEEPEEDEPDEEDEEEESKEEEPTEEEPEEDEEEEEEELTEEPEEESKEEDEEEEEEEPAEEQEEEEEDDEEEEEEDVEEDEEDEEEDENRDSVKNGGNIITISNSTDNDEYTTEIYKKGGFLYSKNNKEEADKTLLPINITQRADNEYNLLQKKEAYENIERKLSIETDYKGSQKNEEIRDIKEIVINDNNNSNGNRSKDKKLRFF